MTDTTNERKLIVESLNKYLSEYYNKHKMNILFPNNRKEEAADVLIDIANFNRVSVKVIISSKRDTESCHVRSILYLELIRLRYGKNQIGALFNRNHATVLHGLKKHSLFIETKDKEYQDYIWKYREYLRQKGIKRVLIVDKPSEKELLFFV